MAPQSSSMWRIDEPITFGQLETGKHTKKQTNTRLRSIIYRSQSMIIGPTWLRNPPRYCHAAKWIRRSLFLFYDATYKRATSTKKRKWKNSTWTSGATTHGRVCVCVCVCVLLFAWHWHEFGVFFFSRYYKRISGRRTNWWPTNPTRTRWMCGSLSPECHKKKKNPFSMFCLGFFAALSMEFFGPSLTGFFFFTSKQMKMISSTQKGIQIQL